MRRLTIATAVMLVVSLAASAWVSCMAELATTASAQMACCNAGHDKCPMHGTADGCCKAESQRQPQVSAATHEVARPILTPPALVAVIPVLFVRVPGGLSRAPAARDTLKGPSPPPYLLGSAFLI